MKTRNRILLTIGSLLVIFSLCTSACATAPSPAPTPTPTPTPTPEPVKPIILKWDTFWAVDYSATVEAVLPTIKAIEEESKGRIKVEVYYAQSLVPSKSQVDYLATGVADVCGISWPYFPGVFTREQIQELPFALPPWDEKRPEVRQQIMGKMFDKYYYKEVDPRIVCLGFASTSDYLIMTTEKKVTTLEDLKGLKLRSAGGMHTDIVKALGATPAQTAPADMVESLSKGVLDGAFWTYAASFGWGISRYIKNSVGLTFCTFPMTSISMNKAKCRQTAG